MLKKLQDYLRRKKGMVEGFILNKEYMSSGTYVFDESLRYITRNDTQTKNSASEMFHNHYYQRTIKVLLFMMRKTLYRKKWYISQPGRLEGFSGTVFRPIRSTNGYRDNKIFDFTTGRVLSILSNKEEFIETINTYKYFNSYFPMPEIYWLDSNELLVMEELVDYVPHQHWDISDSTKVFRELLKDYQNYFSKVIDKGNYQIVKVVDILNILQNNSEMEFITNKISDLLSRKNVPKLRLHGDLWSANILLTNQENLSIKYIDWEYSRNLIFTYDLYNFMWLEAYVNNNDYYLQQYLNGEYDLYFCEIFSIFSLEFDKQHREDYLHLYLVEFYIERLRFMSVSERNSHLQKYKLFMD